MPWLYSVRHSEWKTCPQGIASLSSCSTGIKQSAQSLGHVVAAAEEDLDAAIAMQRQRVGGLGNRIAFTRSRTMHAGTTNTTTLTVVCIYISIICLLHVYTSPLFDYTHTNVCIYVQFDLCTDLTI